MFQQKIGTLSKISSTQVQLSDSLVKVGGQFKRTGTLNLSTATDLDTGSIAASTMYYVYVVNIAGVVSLKASTSNQKPVSINSYKKIGAFYTDASSNIFKVYNSGDINKVIFSSRIDGLLSPSIPTNGNSEWIDGTITRPATGTYNIVPLSEIFSVTPNLTGNRDTINNGTGYAIVFDTSNSSPTFFRYYLRDTGALFNGAHIVYCQKQGIDAIQPDWKDY